MHKRKEPALAGKLYQSLVLTYKETLSLEELKEFEQLFNRLTTVDFLTVCPFSNERAVYSLSEDPVTVRAVVKFRSGSKFSHS